jgi:hypothetical protein
MEMAKRMLRFLAVAALACTGCSVIHFKNGEVPGDAKTREEWHHNLAFNLWEVSSPVDMTTRCPEGKWSLITTKVTFLNGLAGLADDALTAGIMRGAGGVDIWDPQTVAWECAR